MWYLIVSIPDLCTITYFWNHELYQPRELSILFLYLVKHLIIKVTSFIASLFFSCYNSLILIKLYSIVNFNKAFDLMQIMCEKVFFHILVLQEYCVLRESRIALKGVRSVALSISSHEQTQYNRVCCFLIL